MTNELSSLTDRLVKEYLQFTEGYLFVTHDNSNKNIAQSIHDSALNKMGAGYVVTVNIDEMRLNNSPLPTLPQEFKDYLESKLKRYAQDSIDKNVVLMIHGRIEGDGPINKEIMDISKKYGKIGGLSGCTFDVLKAGLHQENISEFSNELKEFISQEKEIIITDDIGTGTVITLNHQKYDLVNSNGILVPGKYGNPIPAEVYTYPESVHGKFIIRGSYGHYSTLKKYKENFAQMVLDLHKTPLIWNIKNGKIIDVTCEDKYLEEESRKEVFEKDTEHGMKIGEIGLPANLYVLNRELTGKLLIDEKGRVHMAHGDGYQDRTKCEYRSIVHSDGLANHVNLYSTRLNKHFMINDKYDPEIFKSLKK